MSAGCATNAPTPPTITHPRTLPVSGHSASNRLFLAKVRRGVRYIIFISAPGPTRDTTGDCSRPTRLPELNVTFVIRVAFISRFEDRQAAMTCHLSPPIS